ncbi:MAG: NAD(P)/FAD-dependent oxidoreductase [Halanaerobiales bacterium]
MDYLIIGAGVAGISAVRELIKERKDNDSITVITDESYPFYYRPRLIECLSGEIDVEDIVIHDAKWFENNEIDLKMNEIVKKIVVEDRLVKTENNKYNYDKLLIANGAHCFVPPIPGREMRNVFALRDAADVERIRQSADKAEKAVVVGGGLLGLESAYNLMKSGLDLTVVEIMPRLLPMQLDIKGAEVLKNLLEDKGLKFRINTQVESFLGNERVDAVKLNNGEVINADLVLISAGIRPNIDLVEGIDDIEVNRGIVVDEYMGTGIEDIYAAGDIAEYQGRVYGIWAPSQKEGQIAGLNMTGNDMVFNPPVSTHKLKVAGINVVSAGELDFDLKEDYEEESDSDRYRRVVYDKQKNPVGIIVVGDFEDTNKILSAIKK